MNHERLAGLLRCPACGCKMRYRPRVYSYCCDGKVLHTYRVKGEIADLVHGDCRGRQRKVDRLFSRIAGRSYEKNVTGATWFDRLLLHMMWGTTKFVPLLFEMLDSVAMDCEPGYFLDIPIGTGIFTAGSYSFQTNLEFIAADFNRRMLESALERVRAEDFGNVMLVRADVVSLPFVDGTFSGVQTMNGIGAFPDKVRALDEIVRVLKPGGKIAGSLYVRGERLLSDIIVGRLGSLLGAWSRPIMTEDDLLGELDKRRIEDVVTRKVGPILFFSGRKSDAEAALEGGRPGDVSEASLEPGWYSE